MNPRDLLRRRRITSWAGLFTLLLLALSVAMDRFSHPSNDWNRFDHHAFHVTRVVDGDTIHIRSTGDSADTIVRLLGIDAPELHDSATGQPAHWAERANTYLKTRIEGKEVSLRVERLETRDRYGRLLAYVYVNDSDCINIDLVRDGQAYADRRFMHSFRLQYEQAEGEARRAQRGLWNGLTEDEMPAWRRVWLHQLPK